MGKGPEKAGRVIRLRCKSAGERWKEKGEHTTQTASQEGHPGVLRPKSTIEVLVPRLPGSALSSCSLVHAGGSVWHSWSWCQIQHLGPLVNSSTHQAHSYGHHILSCGLLKIFHTPHISQLGLVFLIPLMKLWTIPLLLSF